MEGNFTEKIESHPVEDADRIRTNVFAEGLETAEHQDIMNIKQ